MRSVPAILVLLVTLMFGGAMNLLHDCPEQSLVAGAVEWGACDAPACWACDDPSGTGRDHVLDALEDGDDAPLAVPPAALMDSTPSLRSTRTAPSVVMSARVPDATPRPPRA